jgi:dihydrofolate synthase/folylpolyglutamate synthase
VQHPQTYTYQLFISRPNKAYRKETEWLFKQFPSYQKLGSVAYKPSVQNSLEIAKYLENPQDKLKLIHVAGSNGKGSTCSMLASILTEAGYKVGLFTSPHLKDFRERIRIDGACIPEQEVIQFIKRIKEEQLISKPSFFEITFGMALTHFEQNECDICIIETGLGGKLDATNIITPLLSVITNISKEHTQFLGNSLEEIAMEKAGIIKSNVPVVLGQMNPKIQRLLIKDAASKKNSCYVVEDTPSKKRYKLPLLGKYQLENLRTALETIEVIKKFNFKINDQNIQKGLNNLVANTGFIGRLQVMQENPTVIFDVSHNAEGIKATFDALLKLNKNELYVVFGMSSDKNSMEIFNCLPKNAHYYFTEFSNKRSATISELKSAASEHKYAFSKYYNSPQEALKEAKTKARSSDLIVVLGSFFLISEFY